MTVNRLILQRGAKLLYYFDCNSDTEMLKINVDFYFNRVRLFQKSIFNQLMQSKLSA